MKQSSVNKKELTRRVAARAGVGEREAHKVINAAIEEIQSAVMGGESVALTKFGVFEGRMRAKRAARNPRTGEGKTVPARTVPVFRVALGFRDRVIAANATKHAPVVADS